MPPKSNKKLPVKRYNGELQRTPSASRTPRGGGSSSTSAMTEESPSKAVPLKVRNIQEATVATMTPAPPRSSPPALVDLQSTYREGFSSAFGRPVHNGELRLKLPPPAENNVRKEVESVLEHCKSVKSIRDTDQANMQMSLQELKGLVTNLQGTFQTADKETAKKTKQLSDEVKLGLLSGELDDDADEEVAVSPKYEIKLPYRVGKDPLAVVDPAAESKIHQLTYMLGNALTDVEKLRQESAKIHSANDRREEQVMSLEALAHNQQLKITSLEQLVARLKKKNLLSGGGSGGGGNNTNPGGGGHDRRRSTTTFTTSQFKVEEDPAEAAVKQIDAQRKRNTVETATTLELETLGTETDVGPRGEVAVVMTHISGMASLWELAPASANRALQIHNMTLRMALEEHDGYEVKTRSDSFMCVFGEPANALSFALTVQERLLMDVQWSREFESIPHTATVYAPDEVTLLYRGPRVAVGIHVGEPLSEPDPMSGRTDYIGPVVNLCAAVESATEGGHITITGAMMTAEGVADYMNHHRERIASQAMGKHQLLGTSDSNVNLHLVVPKAQAQRLPDPSAGPNAALAAILAEKRRRGSHKSEASNAFTKRIKNGDDVAAVCIRGEGVESLRVDLNEFTATASIEMFRNEVLKLYEAECFLADATIVAKDDGYDKFLFLFSDPKAAVSFSIKLHTALLGCTWPEQLLAWGPTAPRTLGQIATGASAGVSVATATGNRNGTPAATPKNNAQQKSALASTTHKKNLQAVKQYLLDNETSLIYAGVRAQIGVHWCSGIEIDAEPDPFTKQPRFVGQELAIPLGLSQLAEGGETLLSRAMHDQVSGVPFITNPNSGALLPPPVAAAGSTGSGSGAAGEDGETPSNSMSLRTSMSLEAGANSLNVPGQGGNKKQSSRQQRVSFNGALSGSDDPDQSTNKADGAKGGSVGEEDSSIEDKMKPMELEASTIPSSFNKCSDTFLLYVDAAVIKHRKRLRIPAVSSSVTAFRAVPFTLAARLLAKELGVGGHSVGKRSSSPKNRGESSSIAAANQLRVSVLKLVAQQVCGVPRQLLSSTPYLLQGNGGLSRPSLTCVAIIVAGAEALATKIAHQTIMPSDSRRGSSEETATTPSNSKKATKQLSGYSYYQQAVDQLHVHIANAMHLYHGYSCAGLLAACDDTVVKGLPSSSSKLASSGLKKATSTANKNATSSSHSAASSAPLPPGVSPYKSTAPLPSPLGCKRAEKAAFAAVFPTPQCAVHFAMRIQEAALASNYDEQSPLLTQLADGSSQDDDTTVAPRKGSNDAENMSVTNHTLHYGTARSTKGLLMWRGLRLKIAINSGSEYNAENPVPTGLSGNTDAAAAKLSLSANAPTTASTAAAAEKMMSSSSIGAVAMMTKLAKGSEQQAELCDAGGSDPKIVAQAAAETAVLKPPSALSAVCSLASPVISGPLITDTLSICNSYCSPGETVVGKKTIQFFMSKEVFLDDLQDDAEELDVAAKSVPGVVANPIESATLAVLSMDEKSFGGLATAKSRSATNKISAAAKSRSAAASEDDDSGLDETQKNSSSLAATVAGGDPLSLTAAMSGMIGDLPELWSFFPKKLEERPLARNHAVSLSARSEASGNRGQDNVASPKTVETDPSLSDFLGSSVNSGTNPLKAARQLTPAGQVMGMLSSAAFSEVLQQLTLPPPTASSKSTAGVADSSVDPSRRTSVSSGVMSGAESAALPPLNTSVLPSTLAGLAPLNWGHANIGNSSPSAVTCVCIELEGFNELVFISNGPPPTVDPVTGERLTHPTTAVVKAAQQALAITAANIREAVEAHKGYICGHRGDVFVPFSNGAVKDDAKGRSPPQSAGKKAGVQFASDTKDHSLGTPPAIGLTTTSPGPTDTATTDGSGAPLASRRTSFIIKSHIAPIEYRPGRGAGVFVAFDSAQAAIRFINVLQLQMLRYKWPQELIQTLDCCKEGKSAASAGPAGRPVTIHRGPRLRVGCHTTVDARWVLSDSNNLPGWENTVLASCIATSSATNLRGSGGSNSALPSSKALPTLALVGDLPYIAWCTAALGYGGQSLMTRATKEECFNIPGTTQDDNLGAMSNPVFRNAGKRQVAALTREAIAAIQAGHPTPLLGSAGGSPSAVTSAMSTPTVTSLNTTGAPPAIDALLGGTPTGATTTTDDGDVPLPAITLELLSISSQPLSARTFPPLKSQSNRLLHFWTPTDLAAQFLPGENGCFSDAHSASTAASMLLHSKANATTGSTQQTLSASPAAPSTARRLSNSNTTRLNTSDVLSKASTSNVSTGVVQKVNDATVKMWTNTKPLSYAGSEDRDVWYQGGQDNGEEPGSPSFPGASPLMAGGLFSQPESEAFIVSVELNPQLFAALDNGHSSPGRTRLFSGDRSTSPVLGTSTITTAPGSPQSPAATAPTGGKHPVAEFRKIVRDVRFVAMQVCGGYEAAVKKHEAVPHMDDGTHGNGLDRPTGAEPSFDTPQKQAVPSALSAALVNQPQQGVNKQGPPPPVESVVFFFDSARDAAIASSLLQQRHRTRVKISIHWGRFVAQSLNQAALSPTSAGAGNLFGTVSSLGATGGGASSSDVSAASPKAGSPRKSVASSSAALPSPTTPQSPQASAPSAATTTTTSPILYEYSGHSLVVAATTLKLAKFGQIVCTSAAAQPLLSHSDASLQHYHRCSPDGGVEAAVFSSVGCPVIAMHGWVEGFGVVSINHCGSALLHQHMSVCYHSGAFDRGRSGSHASAVGAPNTEQPAVVPPILAAAAASSSAQQASRQPESLFTPPAFLPVQSPHITERWWLSPVAMSARDDGREDEKNVEALVNDLLKLATPSAGTLIDEHHAQQRIAKATAIAETMKSKWAALRKKERHARSRANNAEKIANEQQTQLANMKTSSSTNCADVLRLHKMVRQYSSLLRTYMQSQFTSVKDVHAGLAGGGIVSLEGSRRASSMIQKPISEEEFVSRWTSIVKDTNVDGIGGTSNTSPKQTGGGASSSSTSAQAKRRQSTIAAKDDFVEQMRVALEDDQEETLFQNNSNKLSRSIVGLMSKNFMNINKYVKKISHELHQHGRVEQVLSASVAATGDRMQNQLFGGIGSGRRPSAMIPQAPSPGLGGDRIGSAQSRRLSVKPPKPKKHPSVSSDSGTAHPLPQFRAFGDTSERGSLQPESQFVPTGFGESPAAGRSPAASSLSPPPGPPPPTTTITKASPSKAKKTKKGKK